MVINNFNMLKCDEVYVTGINFTWKEPIFHIFE